MKYLNKLFAFNDRQHCTDNNITTSSSSILTLYSVIFAPEELQLGSKWSSPARAKVTFHSHDKRITFGADDQDQRRQPAETISTATQLTGRRERTEGSIESGDSFDCERRRRSKSTSLAGYLLSASIGKIQASTSSITSLAGTRADDSSQPDESADFFPLTDDEDWILVCEDSKQREQNHEFMGVAVQELEGELVVLTQPAQMALDQTDLDLIKASWVPVRKDPVASGVLLFKGLFTKFPQYLSYFAQFADLDLERIQENKRLIKHAVKVLDTVSFVVDAIGDESKTKQLNDALEDLVKGHLKRRIGLIEFRNLGIVLIDFICDVNQRRGPKKTRNSNGQNNPLHKSLSASNHSSSQEDSETMTSALDKIRASTSPSSSSEEESYLVGGTRQSEAAMTTSTGAGSGDAQTAATARQPDDEGASLREQARAGGDDAEGLSTHSTSRSGPKIDTNALVAAWTKLYSSILDLVRREAANNKDEVEGNGATG